MFRILRITFFCLCVGAISARAAEPVVPSTAAPEFSALLGTVTFVMDPALRGVTVVLVQLVDNKDGQFDVLAEQRFERPKESPLKFSLLYDPHGVDLQHKFLAVARVYVADHLVGSADAEIAAPTGVRDRPVALVVESPAARPPNPK